MKNEDRSLTDVYTDVRSFASIKLPTHKRIYSTTYIPQKFEIESPIPRSHTMLRVPRNIPLPITAKYHEIRQSVSHGFSVAKRIFGAVPESCIVGFTGWVCTYDVGTFRVPSSLFYGIGSTARLPSRGRVLVKIVLFSKVNVKDHSVGPLLEVLYGDGYVHEYASRHLASEGMVPELYIAGVHPFGYFVSVMEFIDGLSLYDVMFPKNDETPNDARGSRYAKELEIIVKRLLRLGVMHHDLHWRNVLVTRSTGKLCVIDFGSSSFIKLPAWFQRILDTMPNINISSPLFLGKYHSQLTPLANVYMWSKDVEYYHPMIEIIVFLRNIRRGLRNK
jgi:hypothetical protein